MRSHAERDRKHRRERQKKKASFPEEFLKIMPNEAVVHLSERQLIFFLNLPGAENPPWEMGLMSNPPLQTDPLLD